VFANIRHRKQLDCFTLRGQTKVNTQWQLYCLVRNIEKIATKVVRRQQAAQHGTSLP
jgi:Transposase DDE domain